MAKYTGKDKFPNCFVCSPENPGKSSVRSPWEYAIILSMYDIGTGYSAPPIP